jgi:Glycine zipper
MKKLAIVSVVALFAASAAGCTSTEQRAGTGAVLGAGTGALIAAATGSSGRGIAAGALIGGAAGAILGAVTDRPGYCWYQRRDGSRYQARCP